MKETVDNLQLYACMHESEKAWPACVQIWKVAFIWTRGWNFTHFYNNFVNVLIITVFVAILVIRSWSDQHGKSSESIPSSESHTILSFMNISYCVFHIRWIRIKITLRNQYPEIRWTSMWFYCDWNKYNH